jgi:hypothetical protein
VPRIAAAAIYIYIMATHVNIDTMFYMLVGRVQVKLNITVNLTGGNGAKLVEGPQWEPLFTTGR